MDKNNPCYKVKEYGYTDCPYCKQKTAKVFVKYARFISSLCAECESCGATTKSVGTNGPESNYANILGEWTRNEKLE